MKYRIKEMLPTNRNLRCYWWGELEAKVFSRPVYGLAAIEHPKGDGDYDDDLPEEPWTEGGIWPIVSEGDYFDVKGLGINHDQNYLGILDEEDLKAMSPEKWFEEQIKRLKAKLDKKV